MAIICSQFRVLFSVSIVLRIKEVIHCFMCHRVDDQDMPSLNRFHKNFDRKQSFTLMPIYRKHRKLVRRKGWKNASTTSIHHHHCGHTETLNENGPEAYMGPMRSFISQWYLHIIRQQRIEDRHSFIEVDT